MRPNRKNTKTEPQLKQIYLTGIIPLNNVQREMPSQAARLYPQSVHLETPHPRQEFRRAHASVGITTGPLLHLTRIGTALAPLIVLEAVKDPTRQMRWIRIVSLLGAAAGESMWALREHQRREEREAAHCR